MARLVKLRKREIGGALAVGAVAALAAGSIIFEMAENERYIEVAQAAEYDVSAFHEVASIGPQDVSISFGDTPAVRSEGPPGAIAQLEAVVEDGRLTIRPRDQVGGNFDWSDLAGAQFYVTLPRLESLSLSGSGSVQADRVTGDSFSANLIGSGEIVIDSMAVDEADFTLAGSGSLIARGEARETAISLTGSGDVESSGLRSETATISITGSGDTALNVARLAQVRVMGSGDVAIAGGAECEVTQIGSGTVDCDAGGE